ncbi:hypothetical protein HID58_093694 [Brassica napus]|uniref:Uncharacterized protein n=1 Tax=Brassica napus TaxID=3708 RepID=A0ABQ7XA13_BRANA|nr:hypothetical protein HID58_093694 [Brassica napus]
MVSRSELKCGEDGMTSSSPDVDRGCVDVIGVDGSFEDVIGVDGSCPFKPRTHKHVYMIPSISIHPQELVHVVTISLCNVLTFFVVSSLTNCKIIQRWIQK